MQSRSQVLVLTRSNRWQAALRWELRTRLPETKLVWALDIDDWMEEVTANAPEATILELTQPTSVSDCEKVWTLASMTPSTAFFAVTSDDTLDWLPLFRVCGFINCCSASSDIRRTIELVRRHCQMQTTPTPTIEQWVENRFPWKPVTVRN